jgi:hypothetical protein
MRERCLPIERLMQSDEDFEIGTLLMVQLGALLLLVAMFLADH